MKKILKQPLLVLIAILLFGCSSKDDDHDDDCMKTITIPQIYLINNQSYSYDITQEVPCDFPEPSEPELIDPPMLENFSYEVLNFEFTPDTGNNTSRLQFEIKLNNPNNFAVSGLPLLTIDTDGLQTTGSFSNDASISCYQIDENSDCILTYDQQSSLDLGIVNTIELINVAYFITN
ncbi:hypothetical protein [Winogradskyella thalassocola]|uniref:Lipoprotein n=1 Tax=Winogradskyella thalassocola TaxID=262004 RepID=A0A1G8IWH9_9FLAO|nr:hypothetical protein [Winogradskyella thalassocola]SDI23415.1 hypothetical protein SAMN04489796_108105 [Winogradskyella thalassocola]